MAHFAQLDENNRVVQTIVVANDIINDLPFPESEYLGVQFCQSLFGKDTVWKQTSINASFRKHYGYPGLVYDEGKDVFYDPEIPDYEVT